MRSVILASIHEGHRSVRNCRDWASQLVCRPDLQTTSFHHCNQHAKANRREGMLVTEPPPTIWYQISTDLFYFEMENYLAKQGQHSKYLEVVQQPKTDSCMVMQRGQTCLRCECVAELGYRRSKINIVSFAEPWLEWLLSAHWEC